MQIVAEFIELWLNLFYIMNMIKKKKKDSVISVLVYFVSFYCDRSLSVVSHLSVVLKLFL